jgi:23S rRNA pseudouridine2605 synthase
VPEMRLQRFLAQAGVASRRHAEALITAGRVRVNGRVITELGTKVAPGDKVLVDGRRVTGEDLVYLLMFKPRGVMTTLEDPAGRPTVKELLPKNLTERVFPVGRLDYNTEGGLLFTNDGDLMQGLLHPSRHVAKVYHAKLRGKVPVEQIEKLRRGVMLKSGKTKPAGAFILSETESNTWLEIELTEGRTHQVKDMADVIGHPVVKLTRVAFAGLSVEGLRPGETRPLTIAEIEDLRKLAAVGSFSKAKRSRRGSAR